MKAIRRSIKGEKNESRPHHISITPKSALAILPPKKVIKALYDYEPDPGNGQELGFHKGDFFHVISRENDPSWYEACNPLIPTARGLVPVSYFEVIGKTERQSAGSAVSGASNNLPDSGYSTAGSHARMSSMSNKPVNQSRMSGTSKGAMVYGIVQYDFSAERPDELEAKAGEAIIVIAQSNPEWFVAKPIGRLGGPGLIPVSFIEIRDMATNQPVADPQKAVQQAGVPKVEEWKKLAADYKNSSITLGKFENSNAGTAQPVDRNSLNNGGQAYSVASSNTFVQSQGYGQANGNRISKTQDSQQTLLAPIQASIPRYCFENDKYWYIIECVMEDGSHWELSRYYQNFYDFQIALLQEFPKEAATDGGNRILPFMPGPVTYVTDAISNGRRESLNDYVKKLLALPPYISKCHLVRQLFAPREGDFELDPRAMQEDYRLSGASQQSSPKNDLSRTGSRQSSQDHIGGNYNGPGSMPPPQRTNHQRNQPSGNNGTALPYRTAEQQPMHRQASSLTQGSAISTPSPAPPSASTTNVSSSGALKIKVAFEDDLIALRVPIDVTFDQLRDKLRERLKVRDDIEITYKNEPTGEYPDLTNDDELDNALQSNSKLMLYVREVLPQ